MGDELLSYDVAISYARPDRQAAEDIAKHLTDRGLQVFYDLDRLAEIVGENLCDYLTDLFRNRARLCVILVSAHYTESDYANWERQAAQARALRESRYIFPIKLDSTDLPGMADTIAYVDWHAYEPHQIVDLICARLERPEGSVTVHVPRPRRDIRYCILTSDHIRQIVNFEREVALFHNMVDGNAPPVLFIQDSSSTGKTTLLHKYMQICETRGVPCSFVDFKHGYINTADRFLQVITNDIPIVPGNAEIEDFISCASHRAGKLVLLLDTFNDAKPLESWIVDKLLIPIHRKWVSNLIVVIAGWQVPALLPGEGNWEETVKWLWKLPRWGRDQIREFGEAIGWSALSEDDSLVNHFLLSSGGEPHVCALIMRRYYRNLQGAAYL